MKSAALLLAVFLLLVAPAAAQSPDPPHRACSWCHTYATTALQQASVKPKKSLLPTRVSSMCLSCHDGLTAQLPDDGHLNHAPTPTRSGLDCTACHDPHGHSGSYRMLHAKADTETEKTAGLEFCRECHTDR